MSAEIIALPARKSFGATRGDWQRLDLLLGLTEDLLPVVCNTSARISQRSKLTPGQIGRVPCMYDAGGFLVGIPGWTKVVSSDEDIDQWMLEPDYGICIVTRLVRGIDIDVTDKSMADAISALAYETLGIYIPTRRREGTSKRLLAVKVEGELGKRRLQVAGQQYVELLGTGQMFVAAGSRADGSRYYWEEGLPNDIPTITMAQLNVLWAALEEQFGTAPSVISRAPGDARPNVPAHDPVADFLAERGLALSETPRGLVVECPWEEEHSGGEAGDSSSMWLHAGGAGHEIGHFKCMHSHCDGRTRADYLAAVGYEIDVSDAFDVIEDTPEEAAAAKARAARFTFVSISEIISRPPPGWIIKGIIPQAELGVVFGPSGSGKSFVMLDLAMAIATGEPWRGHKVKQGRVGYICAEGAGGFRNRLKAYVMRHEMGDTDNLPLKVMETAPNFLMDDDVKDVARAALVMGGVATIIVDTLAKVTPGSNENAGEDMGKAIDNCRRLREATGAMVILVHHTGKDIERGARGWSGIRAAADFEAEVCHDKTVGKRWLQVTKQKDGDDTGRWGFKLEDVITEMDEDGDAVTSCVLVEDDVPAQGQGKLAKAEKLSPWEEAIAETFSELQLGGDVLLSELILQAAGKRPEGGSFRDRKKNVGKVIKKMSTGPKAVFILGDEYVTEVQ